MRTQIDKAYGMPIILNKYLKNKEGKYLVFCRNKAHLEEIKDTVIDWFKTAGFKDINSYIVHSSYEQRNKEYVSFCNDKSHKLKLLFSVNMLNEGLHLSDISGVLLLRPTNSNIVWHQQIGRCIEANNTENPVIIDATNNFQSIRQGIALLKAIKEAVEKEKGKNKDFDDKDFLELDTFFVTGYVQEIQQMFADIEGRLTGSWDVYVKALEQYKAREGDCLVPERHIEVLEDGTRIKLGRWVYNMRLAKEGIGNYLYTEEREQQLERMGFIWNVYKYQFEKNVNDCMEFYERYKRKPSQCSKNKKEKKLGSFWVRQACENRNSKLQLWKIELLNQMPGFNKVRESQFDRFYKMAVEFIRRNGHANIKRKDIIDGYKIGLTNHVLFNAYKKNKLTFEQVERLKKIGIDITVSKYDKVFKTKMELVRQAVSEGVIIRSNNRFYQGVNLYDWCRTSKKKFSEKELIIMNKLMANGESTRPIKIIDFKTNKVLNISSSTWEAGKVLFQDLHVVSSQEQGFSAISNRLKGKVKNPVYKGRFIFQYADSPDHSEPA